MGEFELIRRHFTRPVAAAGVVLGVGDDCALLAPRPGWQLAVSTDMLVEGRHFFADVDPQALGHKALAVNLSDLAAMGAEPLGCTLAFSLPRVDEPWLAAFARGLFALADASGCALVGGDTTRGPLNLCITVFGQVPTGQALRRDAARVGDDVYVSGTLGEARLALEALLGQTPLDAATLARCRARLEWPTPRLALGTALRGLAHAAADVSDGLAGDLGHILTASGVGAVLDAAALQRAGGEGVPLDAVLNGGDDYELVFTAPPAAAAALADIGERVTRIGCITAEPGLWLDEGGPLRALAARGFDHFSP